MREILPATASHETKPRSEQFASVLDQIPGIGEKRKALLLDRFKTVKAVKSASLDDLKEVLPSSAAASVFDYFHENR